ncbi:MAG TPA: pseudouridine synthase [Acidobacteriaceae bacterium]|nr:pseudouridine synthase [Acidobacteriaceae bacterium]
MTASENPHEEPGSTQRLQKIIAAAGVASRRKAEELITAGRVQVNGQTVTALGSKANPASDHIRVDGKLLKISEHHRYFVLNKPKGYVTTVSDPEHRPTVMDLIRTGKDGGDRLYPVGRLDFSSEGLLLMTNDGELANALTRAAARVEKTYMVKVSGQPSDSAINQLRHGVMIDRGTQISAQRKGARGSDEEETHPPTRPAGPRGRVMTAPARIRLLREGENPWYEMILIEGRNREIRKMFEEIGHHVEKIRRVGYGPLVLDLEPGRSRELTPEEVTALHRAAQGRPERSPKSGKPPRKTSRRPSGPAAAKSRRPPPKRRRPTR